MDAEEIAAIYRHALAALTAEPVIVAANDGDDALAYRRLIAYSEPRTSLEQIKHRLAERRPDVQLFVQKSTDSLYTPFGKYRHVARHLSTQKRRREYFMERLQHYRQVALQLPKSTDPVYFKQEDGK